MNYPPTDSRYDWDRHPQRHPPPSITVPPGYSASDYTLQQGRNSHSDCTYSITLKSPTRDVELGKQQFDSPTPPITRRFTHRITQTWNTLRMYPTGRKSGLIPMQEPPLNKLPPLRPCCEHCEAGNDRRRRRMVLFVALVIFLLFLFGNIIFLNVRIVRLSSQATSVLPPATSTAPTNMSSLLSTDAQQCLSQYTLNAPSDPQSYPCSTCLSVLQGVPSSFKENDPKDGEQVQNAIQFCGLRSVFESAGSDGQLALSHSGWAQDVRFCAWQGVRCDGFGRVSSIQLSFPAVPAKIPDELTALTGLTSLQVIGDTNVPAGDLPADLKSLSALTTLHLEATAVNSIPSTTLNALGNLTTLTLVKNNKMTSDMTPGLSSLALQNLVINGQTLPTNPVSALLSGPAARSLQTLDLSSTSLSGSLPSDLSGFSSLVELHLDNNSLTSPLPAQFPASLQSLTLTNNPQLEGQIASGTSFCALPASQLQTCDARGTGLSVLGGCGVCQFV